MKRLIDILKEEAPKDVAKKHGLVYGGFAQWIDPKTREVIGRTIDGKFVWAKGAQENDGKNLGRVMVFNINSDLIHGHFDEKSKIVQTYNHLLRIATQGGAEFYILTPRNGEKEAAKYLHKNGITTGVKLKPFGSGEPQKIRDFVAKLIKRGHKHVQYFDEDKGNISAIESLKATY